MNYTEKDPFEEIEKMKGKPLDEIETPALILDLDCLERNMDRMMSFLRKGSTGIRPHAKTHKTPEIALMQMEKGAVGITCAKLGEAEALSRKGVSDLLVANQVVGPSKVKRAARLAKSCDLKIAVDSEDNVKDLSRAAVEEGSTIGIVVEADIGLKRSGVRKEEDAVKLAQMAEALPGLKYSGIMGYEGHAVFIQDLDERSKVAERAYERLFSMVDALTRAGFPPEIVSSAGTGTYLFAGRKEWITDIQAGSYIFMDTRYAGVEGMDFEQSLAVLSTIVSHPEKDLYIADAGIKSMTEEFGMVSTFPSYGLKVSSMSEEHVKLEPSFSDQGAIIPKTWQYLDEKYAQKAPETLGVKDKILLIPSHSCTTVNLHDVMYGVRDGVVEKVFRITARGKFA